VLTALGEWAIEWMFTEPAPEVVDPVTLTWWMHRRIAPDRLPDRRVVVEFDYRGDDAMIIWIVLDRGEASVCMKPPGFDTDVLVVTDTVAMMRVFSGIETLAEALDAGTIVVEGVPTLRNAFGDWLLGSPFAASMRARATR
jgi:hypothetical protein